MAASKAKRKRIVKQKEQPKGRQIKRDGLSEAYYSLRPSWNFHTCDKKMWPLDEVHAKAVFWKGIWLNHFFCGMNQSRHINPELFNRQRINTVEPLP